MMLLQKLSEEKVGEQLDVYGDNVQIVQAQIRVFRNLILMQVLAKASFACCYLYVIQLTSSIQENQQWKSIFPR